MKRVNSLDIGRLKKNAAGQTAPAALSADIAVSSNV